MNFKPHLIIGTIVAVILSVILWKTATSHYKFIVLGLILCILFSLFPDIDIQSRSRQIFYIIFVAIGAIFCMYGYFTNDYILILEVLAILVSALFVPVMLPHRGITHKIITAIIVSAVFLLFSWILSCYVFVGYLTHIILDKQKIFK